MLLRSSKRLIKDLQSIFYVLSRKFIAEQGATSVEESLEGGHKP